MKTKEKLLPTDKMFEFTVAELCMFTVFFVCIGGFIGYGMVALVLMTQALVGG